MLSPRRVGNMAIEREHDQTRAEADLQVAAGPERAEPRPAAQPAPAACDRLARSRRRKARPGAGGRAAGRAESTVRSIFSAVSKSTSFVTPSERIASMWSWSCQVSRTRSMSPARDRQPATVEIRVEIIIRNDEYSFAWIGLVVRFELGGGLEPQGRLAAPLLAENQRRRRIGRTAEELVPRRMVDRRQTNAV